MKVCRHYFVNHKTFNASTQEYSGIKLCIYCHEGYSSGDKFDEFIGELERVVKSHYPELREMKVMDLLLPFGRKVEKRTTFTSNGLDKK